MKNIGIGKMDGLQITYDNGVACPLNLFLSNLDLWRSFVKEGTRKGVKTFLGVVSFVDGRLTFSGNKKVFAESTDIEFFIERDNSRVDQDVVEKGIFYLTILRGRRKFKVQIYDLLFLWVCIGNLLFLTSDNSYKIACLNDKIYFEFTLRKDFRKADYSFFVDCITSISLPVIKLGQTDNLKVEEGVFVDPNALIYRALSWKDWQKCVGKLWDFKYPQSPVIGMKNTTPKKSYGKWEELIRIRFYHFMPRVLREFFQRRRHRKWEMSLNFDFVSEIYLKTQAEVEFFKNT